MRRMINQTTNQTATPITRTASGGANIRASFSSTYDLRIAISTAPLFMHSSTSLRVKRSAKRSLPNAVSHSSLVVGTKTSIPLQLECQEVHPIHRTANASHNSSNPRPRRTAISAPLHRHRPGRSARHAACANRGMASSVSGSKRKRRPPCDFTRHIARCSHLPHQAADSRTWTLLPVAWA